MPTTRRATFPPDFLFGCATSAYQIEGAAAEDGRGLSVWDVFCRRPGAVWQQQSGESACQHYRRYPEDVELMRALGLRAYRFSISWPRVLPEGRGAINQAGLAFYERLTDRLLEAGITPMVTLFHWDYPFELYCRGGWLNPESAAWFAEYAALVVDRLSDRVRHWVTLNEPQCFLWLGHHSGRHAPGDQLAMPEVLRAAHHLLLAHGRAVQAIRAAARRPACVGYAPVARVSVPASPSPGDVAAAREHGFGLHDDGLWTNAFWLDPLLLGAYPDDVLSRFGAQMPPVRAEELALMAQPLDFLGLNIYSGQRIACDPSSGAAQEQPFPVGHPTTATGWWVLPEAMYWGPALFAERYRLPIMITENGMANVDWVGLDGRVHDPQRIDYLQRHLLELRRAIADGVDVRGYFVWSLLDNFEWADGYQHRFGLVYCDYATQQRIPKDSAAWFARVIATHGASLDHGDSP